MKIFRILALFLLLTGMVSSAFAADKDELPWSQRAANAAMARWPQGQFRNRLDATVSFKALDEEIILRVVDKFLLQLEGQLAEKKVEVTFTDALDRKSTRLNS